MDARGSRRGRELRAVYRRRRGRFGNRLVLSDRPAELVCDIAPDRRREGFRRAETTSELDASHNLSAANFATVQVPLGSAGMQHQEGGWPAKAVSEDARTAFRSGGTSSLRLDHRQFRAQVDSAAAVLRQNECVDIYQRFFAASPEPSASFGGDFARPEGESLLVSSVESGDGPGLRHLLSFRDPRPDSGREVVQTAWERSERGRRLAVAFAQPGMRHGACLPWEAVHLHSYEYVVADDGVECSAHLLPPAQLSCIEYSPTDRTLLAGVSDGTVCLFDSRASLRPTGVSSPQAGHCEPVAAAAWLRSRPGIEFCTTASDGMLFVWDVRRLATPLDSLVLRSQTVEDGLVDSAQTDVVLDGSALAVCSASRVAVATKQGVALLCGLRTLQQRSVVAAELAEHSGPVRVALAHPDAPQLLVTLGDWHLMAWNAATARLCHKSIPQDALFTAGTWLEESAALVTADEKGRAHVWDMSRCHDAPSSTCPVTSGEPVTTLSARKLGNSHVVAAGDSAGSVHLLTLPAREHERKGAAHALAALGEAGAVADVFESLPRPHPPASASHPDEEPSSGLRVPSLDDVAVSAAAARALWARAGHP